MTKIFSYVLAEDHGSAPNPFWGKCSLTICKPHIRRVAEVGDWIIGTGSTNSYLKDKKRKDFSKYLVFAMKVTEKMSLKDYDDYCKKVLVDKIPNWNSKDWKHKLGDCIYDYSNGNDPILRKSVHEEFNIPRDLRGVNALISNHFYYFGEDPIEIPDKNLIKKGPGHKIITDEEHIREFVNWISKFEKNKIYANPQKSYLYQNIMDDEIKKTCSQCSKNNL